MKMTKKLAAALTLAAAPLALAATPAAAQVMGIATSSPELALARATARATAYQQIETTYAAQIQQARTLQQEIQTLQASLDTNNDNQLSQAEISANPSVVQQVQQKEQQIATATQPIALAQYYVIEQLIRDFNNAQQQVRQQKNIQIMLTPDSIQWAPDSIDVTDDLVAAINQRLPSVAATPPAGWQPTMRQTIQLHQSIQQILQVAAQQQAAQAAAAQQQGNASASGGR